MKIIILMIKFNNINVRRRKQEPSNWGRHEESHIQDLHFPGNFNTQDMAIILGAKSYEKNVSKMHKLYFSNLFVLVFSLSIFVPNCLFIIIF